MPKEKKILVAEDEKPMARALELKLTSAGFSVSVAYDGADALEKMSKNKYDLLLLDLVMPKKDGFTVLEEMKEKGIKIPVIVATNLSQDGDKEKTKQLGASEYLVKSDVPISDVIEIVKKTLK
ncbi:MAG: response regulator [Candidatus Magasanikbacteria bacterium]|nr:response regulator [Candidatus Magasanikbacteria bacterium]